MSNYSKTTDFAAKDSLPSGDSGKIIRGSEFETEFDNISTAIATKADAASPTFTGTVTIDGLTVNGNTTLGNDATDTVTVTADIASNLIPSADDTYNLGASGAEWNDLYVDGVAYIDTIDGFATTGNVTFGDNDKAIFGAGSDLQIYHDGSDSYINDNGSGNLVLRGGNFVVDASSAGNERLITANATSKEVKLYYNDAQKLATTSTGVDVTGTATVDGLTVDGTAEINSSNPQLYMFESDSTDANTLLWGQGSAFRVVTVDDAESTFTTRFRVNHTTGDVFFYEDTGTTAKFFWDASLERLGVGNSSPTTTLDVTGTVTAEGLTLADGGDRTITGPLNNDLIINSRGNTPGEGIRLQSLGSDRLVIDDTTGDISFYEDTGTDAKLFWDASAESLGIGTDSPAQVLHVKDGTAGTSGTDLDVANFEANGAGLGGSGFKSGIRLQHASDTDKAVRITAIQTADYSNTMAMGFEVSDSGSTPPYEAMRIAANGNVGIGTDSPVRDLHVAVADSGLATIGFTNSTTGSTASDGLAVGIDGAEHGFVWNHEATPLKFATNNTERMRIDSSGNVLVGKTSASVATAGIQLLPDSDSAITRDAGTVLYLNRNTSDGTIAEFRKDGTTVGSIGTTGGDLMIGTGDVNIRFDDGADAIVPRNSDGSGRDAAVDIGLSTVRFKDLYLSGGAYIGGVAAANKLDDYEEGSFTPVIADASSGGNTGTATTATGRYTKIGNRVFVQVFLFDIDTTGMTGANTFIVRDMPFTSSTGNSGAIGATQAASTTFTGYVNAFYGSSRTYVYFRDNASGLGGSNITVSDLTSGSADLYFTLSYEAA